MAGTYGVRPCSTGGYLFEVLNEQGQCVGFGWSSTEAQANETAGRLSAKAQPRPANVAPPGWKPAPAKYGDGAKVGGMWGRAGELSEEEMEIGQAGIEQTMRELEGEG